MRDADAPPKVVAVINASADIVELLSIVLEKAGYAAISAHVDEIKRGALDLAAFIGQHRPKVIVYDVAPPYDRQWQFLQHVRAMPALKGIPFVLTSTNPKRLREVAGTDESICEIVGKPYDLDEIVKAVRTVIGD